MCSEWRDAGRNTSVTAGRFSKPVLVLLKPLQRFGLQQRGDGRRPVDLHHAGQRLRPLAGGGRGEVVAQAVPLLLGRLQARIGVLGAAGQHGLGRRRQQLQDVRGSVAQVLPGLLPRHVPQLHVGFQLLHQQPDDVFVAVDGGDVERRLTRRRLGVHIEAQAFLLHPVAETDILRFSWEILEEKQENVWLWKKKRHFARKKKNHILKFISKIF